MSRYGTFLYGDQKYGASTNTNLLWALEIDWEDDDVWSGDNEALRMVRFETTRGKSSYIAADGHGFERPIIGKLIVEVDNYDGRYDAWDTSGDLYGYLAPGKKCKFWVKDGIDGTEYNVFTGTLADVIPIGRNKTANLIIEDGNRWLSGRDTEIALQSSVKADAIIEAILDNVSWPWTQSLETGVDTLSYYWTSGRKAITEIDDVVNAGMGYFFIAKDGTATYWSRHHSDSPAFVITQDLIGKDIYLPQPWEFKRNVIKVQAHPLVTQAVSTLWTLNEIPLIAAGESLTLWGSYTYDSARCAATSVVVGAGNYTANAQEDGGGADLTADFTVTTSVFSETIKMVVTNGGAVDGYLTLLRVKGDAITAPDAAVIVEDAGESYPVIFELDLDWLQDVDTAQDLATFLGGYLGDPQPFPEIIIRNRTSYQFGIELCDRITLTIAALGIDQDFRVLSIEHSGSGTCQDIVTKIKLYPAYDMGSDTYWILGVSLLGVDTIMGW